MKKTRCFMNKILHAIYCVLYHKDNKVIVDEVLLNQSIEANVSQFLYLCCSDLTEDRIKKKLKSVYVSNVIFNYNQIEQLNLIKQNLDSKSIKYSILKGVHLKDLYNDESLRFMSDIDIFIEKKDIDKTKKTLFDMGYSLVSSSDHDIAFKKNSILIELHYLLIPKKEHGRDFFKKTFDKLKRVDNSYEYVFAKKEDEYIYYFFHLLKHFEEHGIGIRNFVDLYLFISRYNLDFDYIHNSYKYTDYYEDCIQLEKYIKTLFFESEENEIIFEKIIQNKTFGSKDELVKNEFKKRTFIKWIIFKAFPPIEHMLYYYPFLRKKILYIVLPFLYIHHIIKYSIFRLGYSCRRIRRAREIYKEK